MKKLFILFVFVAAVASLRQAAAQSVDTQLSTTAHNSTDEYQAELAQGAAAGAAMAPFSALGSWRGVFAIRPGVEVPFNFEIRPGSAGDAELFFLNATESFEGGRVRVTVDSLFVALDQFDNQLAFAITGGTLSGVLRRQDGTGKPLPVTAVKNEVYRFKADGPPPTKDITGTYDVIFQLADGKEEHSVGIFKQQGAKLTATFLHITGDSRYLDGIVEGNDRHNVSLQDPKFKDKVVIVTIGGTWCPNCIDETAFLAPWYKANHSRGIEVVSLQYERQTDSAYVRKVLTRMRDRYDIQYEQLIGGIADKQAVATSLPALNTFLAFPTTLFIDRQGRVAKVHTGFDGPATGQYYEDFIKEFNAEVDLLAK